MVYASFFDHPVEVASLQAFIAFISLITVYISLREMFPKQKKDDDIDRDKGEDDD